MEEMFYIVKVNDKDNWWQLRVRDTHYVVSCGEGLEYILKCFRTILERYKTSFNFRVALSKCEKFPVSEDTLKKYKEDLKESTQYDHYLEAVAQEYRKDRSKNAHKLLKKNKEVTNKSPLVKKTLIKKNTTEEVTPEQRPLKKKILSKRPLIKLNKK